nr:unnamed protein product [Callosobruchus analis]
MECTYCRIQGQNQRAECITKIGRRNEKEAT